MQNDTFFGDEAPLSELLDDPICRALMRRDGLDPAAVERRLRREAARLRATRSPAGPESEAILQVGLAS